jgi:hypothetical protein
MIITETQRFCLQSLTFVTIALLVLLNVYTLEIFLLLIIVEFLVLVELTKPSVITNGVAKEHLDIYPCLRHRVRHLSTVTVLR